MSRVNQMNNTMNSIKYREEPKDVFLTPPGLAKEHIKMIDFMEDDLWLDPCKNSGNYFNQFPTSKKDYCEILEGIDFLKYEGEPQIICDNPPYSMLNKWHDKVISLNPRVYATLISFTALTGPRINKFQQAGYGIKKLTYANVSGYFGMTLLVVFKKTTAEPWITQGSCVGFLTTKYYTKEKELGTQCEGITAKGTQCKSSVRGDDKFCRLHCEQCETPKEIKPKQVCEGFTKSKKPCKNKANGKFCFLHC